MDATAVHCGVIGEAGIGNPGRGGSPTGLRRILAGLVLMIGVAAPVSGQQQDAQAIRVAVAEYVGRRIPLMPGYAERSERTLMPTPLRYRIENGKMIQTAQAPSRAEVESKALAAALHAKLAMPADTIWCDPPGAGTCHGTEGVQVRLGDPDIRGESATMLFALQTRSRVRLGERDNHRTTVWYAIYLVREAGRWRPVASSVADTRYISPPHPIGPDGMPVKLPTGGG